MNAFGQFERMRSRIFNQEESRYKRGQPIKGNEDTNTQCCDCNETNKNEKIIGQQK